MTQMEVDVKEIPALVIENDPFLDDELRKRMLPRAWARHIGRKLRQQERFNARLRREEDPGIRAVDDLGVD